MGIFFVGGKTQLPPNVGNLPSQVQWWEFFYLGPLGRWLPKPLHWSGGTRRGWGGGLYLLVLVAGWNIDLDWVDVFPIEDGDIPASYLSLLEGKFVGRCLFLLDPDFFPQMDYPMFLKIPGFQFCKDLSRICNRVYFGGGFYFHTENWGNDSQFDEHILETGWFNHQLVIMCSKKIPKLERTSF